MQEIIAQFIDAMSEAGLSPANASDIKPDNRRHDYQLEGDPRSKRKGYYKLKIDGEFGFGFFGDYRDSECISFTTKMPRKYTKEERAAFAKRMEAERIAQDAEIKAQHERVATEAQDSLVFISEATTHPYLARKGIKPHGIFIEGDNLVIPMGDYDRTWNYQTIAPDGTKRFLKDAKKQGTWYKIPGDETICICEGFSTGASIHEATGHTVIVAWDKGNLEPVAKIIRKHNQDAEIIITADNDQFGKENGGLITGKKAALAISAKMVYPVFQDLTSKPTDFNDLHALEGLEAVATQIREAGRSTAGGVTITPNDSGLQPPGGGDDESGFTPPPDWQEHLQRNKKGELIERSVSNLLLILRYHPDFMGIFSYDSFAKRIIVHRCPPWEDENLFKVRQLYDYDYFRLEAYLEKEHGLKASKDKCADVILSTAQQPENTFNPAADYFKALQWDGVHRIDSWLSDYVSDGAQPKEYLKTIGRKFLCGLASRAMNPGVKFDTMIILEGKQNAGKSYLSRILATIQGVEYFLDDFKDIENKDALMKMQGKLVVEFPEISAMRKAEINDLKAFLGRTHDVFRPPYGRNTIESPRQCVFVGTVNPEGPYLRDVTGNRRYWPISCRTQLDIERLKAIVPLLHAEAAHLVRKGEILWLNQEEYNLATAEQDKRVLTDVWADNIQEIIGAKTEIQTDEILNELGISKDKRNPLIAARINQTMISLGWHPSRLSIGTRRPRGFKKIFGSQQELSEATEEEIKW